jgi:hypothetical protein
MALNESLILFPEIEVEITVFEFNRYIVAPTKLNEFVN